MANFHPAASSLANFNDTLNINDLYDSTLLSCTLAIKESRFLGCGQFCLIKRILDIKHMFPCSFGNKHMRLLTRVYSTPQSSIFVLVNILISMTLYVAKILLIHLMKSQTAEVQLPFKLT